MKGSKLKAKRILALLMGCLLCASSMAALAENDLQVPTVEVVQPSFDPDSADDPFGTTEEPTEVPSSEPTSAPTAVPIPTEIPMETESPYEVAVLMPNGWTNAAKATVSIAIVKRAGLSVQQLEVCLNHGQWEDITADYLTAADGEIALTVTENATLLVRVTDPHGHQFETESEIQVFDRTPPAVTAGIESASLHVQAQDALSGVGGIQVNGLLFTTMLQGTLNVPLTEALSKYERLAVRAFDYAGNFSEPVTLDNPYYTPESTATAAPSINTGIATQVPQVIPTATPYVVYTSPEPTATPIVETEYITIGPGMPYLADGNSHTLDVLYSAATNKQFITMQTKSGNTFYLVIDYDKPIDEETEMYETYFLNLVNERDLLALMDEDEMPTATPEIVYVTPEPTSVPVPTTAPDTGEKPDNGSNQTTAIFALVAILAFGGAGGFLYFKSKKGKTQTRSAADYGFDDADEEDDTDDSAN